MIKIAVLVSGGGTNLQALIDKRDRIRLSGGELSLVVSSAAGTFALERAKNAGIEGITLERKKFADNDEYDSALSLILAEHNIGLVVLAGFLCVLGPQIIKNYNNRIINVHPSLIPSFCGKGFYGLRVHEEAIKCGVKVTGATVHFVNEVVDGGKIILQKAVDVLPSDTPETLQLRVMRNAEWELLPKAVELFCSGEIL